MESMNCIRCEIARAKLRAIIYANMRWPAEELAADLTARYAGEYFAVRNEAGAMIYRRNNNPEASAIEIWLFSAT